MRLDLPCQLRVAVVVEQALLRRYAGALAIHVDRAAFEDQRRGIARCPRSRRPSSPRRSALVHDEVRLGPARFEVPVDRPGVPPVDDEGVSGVAHPRVGAVVISTTRTSLGRAARACSNCPGETAMVTGSLGWIAAATAANASSAGLAPRRQLSSRSARSSSTPSCGSNSPGMWKPSTRRGWSRAGASSVNSTPWGGASGDGESARRRRA